MSITLTSFEQDTLDYLLGTAAYEVEAMVTGDKLFAHMVHHLTPKILVGYKYAYAAYGVPQYDLELAATRQLPMSEIPVVCCGMMAGYAPDFARWVEEKCHGLADFEVDNLRQVQELVGTERSDYLQHIGVTLRYLDALSLAVVDWEAVEYYVPGLRTKRIVLQRVENSFFGAVPLRRLQRQFYENPLPDGKLNY